VGETATNGHNSMIRPFEAYISQ